MWHWLFTINVPCVNITLTIRTLPDGFSLTNIWICAEMHLEFLRENMSHSSQILWCQWLVKLGAPCASKSRVSFPKPLTDYFTQWGNASLWAHSHSNYFVSVLLCKRNLESPRREVASTTHAECWISGLHNKFPFWVVMRKHWTLNSSLQRDVSNNESWQTYINKCVCLGIWLLALKEHFHLFLCFSMAESLLYTILWRFDNHIF